MYTVVENADSNDVPPPQDEAAIEAIPSEEDQIEEAPIVEAPPPMDNVSRDEHNVLDDTPEEGNPEGIDMPPAPMYMEGNAGYETRNDAETPEDTTPKRESFGGVYIGDTNANEEGTTSRYTEEQEIEEAIEAVEEPEGNGIVEAQNAPMYAAASDTNVYIKDAGESNVDVEDTNDKGIL